MYRDEKICICSICYCSSFKKLNEDIFLPSVDYFYINRGLERGLNLETLNAKVLNKTVTLHLPKLLGGAVTSEHIAQLALEDEIIFTEFK